MRDVPEEMTASVQHLELLSASISKVEARLGMLREARAQTLKQVAAAAGRSVREWGIADQLALYNLIHAPGLTAAWVAAGLPSPQRMRATVGPPPNDPNGGGWVGTFDPGAVPQASQPRPPKGRPVVYVLYGPDLSPIYCGSTQDLNTRLKWHRRDGKVFIAWRAVPYATREEAYAAEDRLLKESCPPLNRKASR
jgi:hypothetical protein